VILDQYKAHHLLFNSNFCEPTSEPGLSGYRGDLVMIDGGLDDKGHPNPPQLTLKGAVILADEKIHLFIGSLDRIDQLPTLLAKFQGDLAADAKVMLFVVNAKDRAQYDLAGNTITIIPLVQGMCWNEAIDELALEKGDFKGQAPADKLYTLYREMKSYSPRNAPLRTLEELLSAATNVTREAWGAV
jgi:hypothetical protein